MGTLLQSTLNTRALPTGNLCYIRSDYPGKLTDFQLQATILEIYGVDCIDEGFIDGQLYWLNKWQEAMNEFTEGH